MNFNLFLKIILFIPAVILVSFYYFPMGIGISGINTKTALAVVGLFLGFLILSQIENASISKNFIKLMLTACLFSLICFLSVTINHTQDYTYTTYLISMFVWLFAAFAVIFILKCIYNKVSVVALCDFLIVACLIQCVSAIMIDQIPAVHDFVAKFQDTSWIESVDRLYGISTSLDTAGIHFAVVLFMLTYLLANKSKEFSGWRIVFYWLSFGVITVIGNMMARTTIIGTGLGLMYIFWKSGRNLFKDYYHRRVLRYFAVMIIILMPIVVFYYNTNERIYDNIRFGFEGFFSMAENGQWNVASNNTLKNMIVFPSSLETWIIGDGYIENPKSDPYYVGPITEGYYMNTDIGYLRFIFYCGLLGLVTFSTFIIQAGLICGSRLPKYRIMCIGLIILNFILWLKVSTDLFFIFALLLSIAFLREGNEGREVPTQI